jgi:predicted RNA polymerase sigma factor
VLLEDQDRALWDRAAIAEGVGAARQGDAPPPPRPLPGAGGDRGAARSRAHRRATDWSEIDTLYATPRAADAVARCHAEPRVAVAKLRGRPRRSR